MSCLLCVTQDFLSPETHDSISIKQELISALGKLLDLSTLEKYSDFGNCNFCLRCMYGIKKYSLLLEQLDELRGQLEDMAEVMKQRLRLGLEEYPEKFSEAKLERSLPLNHDERFIFTQHYRYELAKDLGLVENDTPLEEILSTSYGDQVDHKVDGLRLNQVDEGTSNSNYDQRSYQLSSASAVHSYIVNDEVECSSIKHFRVFNMQEDVSLQESVSEEEEEQSGLILSQLGTSSSSTYLANVNGSCEPNSSSSHMTSSSAPEWVEQSPQQPFVLNTAQRTVKVEQLFIRPDTAEIVTVTPDVIGVQDASSTGAVAPTTIVCEKTDTGRVKCPVCDVEFSRKFSMEVHFRKMHQGLQEPYNCDFCGSSFRKRLEYRQHRKMHRSGEVDGSRNPAMPAQKFSAKSLFRSRGRVLEMRKQCSVCPKTFQAQFDLDIHFRRVHLGDLHPYKCQVCSLAFRQRGVYREHRKLHQPVQETTHQNTAPDWKCTDCSLGFRKKFDYRYHVRAFHQKSTTPYECQSCSLCFETFEQYKEHRKMHNAVVSLERITSSKLNLAPASIALPADSHPAFSGLPAVGRSRGPCLPCPECPKKFCRQFDLDIHFKKKHKGITKPYECDCGESFENRDVYREHRRTHRQTEAERFLSLLADDSHQNDNEVVDLVQIQ